VAGVITFEPEKVYRAIEKQAIRGVALATKDAAERIRKHAPVRKLFQGTTYKVGKSGFRKPINRRVSYGGGGQPGERHVGHANSAVPVFRTVHPTGKTFITGDFRRVNIATGRLDKIATGYRQSTIGKGGPSAFGSADRGEVSGREGSTDPGELAGYVVSGGRTRKINPKTLQPRSATKLLTSRGGYEVRSGRANFTSGGATRVGGRLRGEIHDEGPVVERSTVWGYVVSATKDPQTGRLYPRDQEFGTSHHPAHPFMRPGLQESRGSLRRHLRESIRTGAQS